MSSWPKMTTWLLLERPKNSYFVLGYMSLLETIESDRQLVARSEKLTGTWNLCAQLSQIVYYVAVNLVLNNLYRAFLPGNSWQFIYNWRASQNITPGPFLRQLAHQPVLEVWGESEVPGGNASTENMQTPCR